MKKIWLMMIFGSMIILTGCLNMNPTYEEIYKSILIPEKTNTDIDIPQTYDHESVELTWTSDNPAVLSTLGVINQQEEDILVTLMLEISINGLKRKFEFNIIVLQREKSEQDIVNQLIEALEMPTETNLNLSLILRDEETKATYQWHSYDVELLTHQGKVMIPEVDSKVILGVTVSLGQAQASKTFEIMILSKLDHEDIFESIIFSEKISTNLDLNGMIDYKGVTFVWESSNPEAITPEGFVTRSNKDVDVTLTLKLTLRGIEKEKQYQVTIQRNGKGAEINGLTYYKSIEGLDGAELSKALNKLINNYTKISYGDARYVLEKSDLYTNEQGETYVRGIYDHHKIATRWISDGQGAWQREHVWPQSRLGEEADNDRKNIASDLHNLRAIAGYKTQGGTGINQTRSNRYYVDGSGVAKTVGSDAFYPGDQDKGDVARILFYMVVMYPEFTLSSKVENIKNNSLRTMGSLDMLLKWHKEDPVDAFEVNRNNYIYNGEKTPQGNRNPFIDLPDLVDLVFGTDTTIESWNLNQAIAMINTVINYVTPYEIKRNYQQI